MIGEKKIRNRTAPPVFDKDLDIILDSAPRPTKCANTFCPMKLIPRLCNSLNMNIFVVEVR
jgi:hypothetical protein